jgi:hypothetical protein
MDLLIPLNGQIDFHVVLLCVHCSSMEGWTLYLKTLRWNSLNPKLCLYILLLIYDLNETEI